MVRLVTKRVLKFLLIVLLFIFIANVCLVYIFDSSLNNNLFNKFRLSHIPDTEKIISNNAGDHLHSCRFDLIFKMVYAYFYATEGRVPKTIENAYAEHLQVWNNFHEYCKIIRKSWFDSKHQCVDKNGLGEFLASFQNTMNSIKMNGFNSNMSQIPVDVNGFLLNGAHRLAASIVLSKNVTFQYLGYRQHYEWDYIFFKKAGLSEHTADTAMLEWMRVQHKLPSLKSKVFILSVFSDDSDKDKTMRGIVKDKCAKDKWILYEKKVTITQNGAKQLLTHMYGYQNWLHVKIKDMLTKFKTSTTFDVLFVFFYARQTTDLVKCKTKIRELYNNKVFKSTAHIPDTVEENLILAQMVLNKNSILFMNRASNGLECKNIAQELAIRSSLPSIKMLPQIYLGKEDIMVDSGAVLSFFDLRKRTDVDLLFLRKIDVSILGKNNKMNIQAHAFRSNSISTERAWGQEHLDENINEFDIFYDPDNYGFCYGVKYVSLQQLIRYKQKRNEPKKDEYDVELLTNFLERNKS